ncbi:putative D-isomer specific 2-hydroxyacid dehydrogenase [Actinoplanes missouriensis 431]|uniref:Putative D-isomer specific 2-hydroxyacid dehydrogenase n=1 Tax=Actinoplanes missouriensis (strain ATCC 14538 / DSM 43046 / CBS 188.64 / JCM 3121 / NBRC 102363 / NCIMB 12654 / NRRL B-3342 / UNCC 431) TaxID=512565 RepID=I0HCX0_ACTM4|nr:phosphoglycerate dehydrogenase [Actinoplanes missouriensis]BAL90857.1 putative D-isomer specific 2-hydroxyacid dehydrogenase [Actinoplanes missouriensis 431]
MKVLLPDTIELDLPLDTVVYAVGEPIPDEHTDAEVLVTWGNPAGTLADAARRLTKLRWVQSLAAGPDMVLEAGFAPDVLVTAGLGLHDHTVTEHTLAMVLAAARRLNLLVRAQIGRRWAEELGGIQPVRQPVAFRTLRDANVVIWGFGGIAGTLAPLLTALGARVTGVARSAGTRHGFPVVTADDLPWLLPATDLLISILPATPATVRAIDARILNYLQPHAWVVNVGRGATLDEVALLNAIRSGRLAGAALDVFATEPLPESSGLWDEPNVIITPHAAGGRPIGAEQLIMENVAAYREGRPLRNLVSR